MRILAFLLLLIISSTAVNAQNQEKRPLADFFEIRVNDGIEVELIKSDNPRIEIETEGVSTDKVITDLSSGRLRIRMRIGIYPGVQVKCKVYFKDLTMIQAMAAGEQWQCYISGPGCLLQCRLQHRSRYSQIIHVCHEQTWGNYRSAGHSQTDSSRSLFAL